MAIQLLTKSLHPKHIIAGHIQHLLADVLLQGYNPPYERIGAPCMAGGRDVVTHRPTGIG